MTMDKIKKHIALDELFKMIDEHGIGKNPFMETPIAISIQNTGAMISPGGVNLQYRATLSFSWSQCIHEEDHAESTFPRFESKKIPNGGDYYD